MRKQKQPVHVKDINLCFIKRACARQKVRLELKQKSLCTSRTSSYALSKLKACALQERRSVLNQKKPVHVKDVGLCFIKINLSVQFKMYYKSVHIFIMHIATVKARLTMNYPILETTQPFY